MRVRKSLEETWRYLEAQGWEPPRGADGSPLVRGAMPNQSDEILYFSFYKHGLEDSDLTNLSIPRTFFGRSSFVRVKFAGSDLTESRACWNDFEGCDFSGADLSRCDLRASIYKGCNFAGANLCGADLRHSTFEDCEFAGADMTDAITWDEDYDGCVFDFLTDEQQESMTLTPDQGPEPDGG